MQMPPFSCPLSPRNLVFAAMLCLALAGLGVYQTSSLLAEAPVGTSSSVEKQATPAETVLLTVFLKHDQSKTLGEIRELLEQSEFWKRFPPEGIEVESWRVLMGLGHVITLKVPPSRLREVNLAIEQTAWKAFRSEVYVSYDYKEIFERQRQKK